MKSIMQFKEYHVLETKYKYDPFFSNDDSPLIPNFDISIEYEDEENKETAWVGLGVTLGDEQLQTHSFYVQVKVLGLFEIQTEEVIDDELLFNLYHVNAVAIMFPYLRSIVSELSGKGSETPIILPTLNIAEMVKEKIESE